MVLPVLLLAMGLQAPAVAKSRLHVGKAAIVLPASSSEPAHVLAGLSPDQIIAIVEKRHHAKVVKIDKDELRGRRVYVLRLQSKERRIWTVKVDAETGGEL